MAEQDQPIAGKAVEGAGHVAETTARQVEGAIKEATEFASENVGARALGYIRALNNIIDEALQAGLDIKKEVGQVVLRELGEVNQKANEEIGKATSGS